MKNAHEKIIIDSPWTKFLGPEKEIMEDQYAMYKDKVMFQCENLVGSISKELLMANPGLTPDEANKNAISYVMEQMLALQYEHTPRAQADMTKALFSNLPALEIFRLQLVHVAQEKSSITYKLKNLFSKKNK